MNTIEKFNENVMATYGRYPLVMESGSNVLATDENGKEYTIKSNELFNFVTFLQDEVHNTAIEYHRKLRQNRIKYSELDNIDGIGEIKKKALLKKFKSVKKIKEASVEELCEVEGINEALAKKILFKLS